MTPLEYLEDEGDRAYDLDLMQSAEDEDSDSQF